MHTATSRCIPLRTIRRTRICTISLGATCTHTLRYLFFLSLVSYCINWSNLVVFQGADLRSPRHSNQWQPPRVVRVKSPLLICGLVRLGTLPSNPSISLLFAACVRGCWSRVKFGYFCQSATCVASFVGHQPARSQGRLEECDVV